MKGYYFYNFVKKSKADDGMQTKLFHLLHRTPTAMINSSQHTVYTLQACHCSYNEC